MNEKVELLLFNLEGQRYALKLADVERVVRAVHLSPLLGAPHVIRGVFDLNGRIVPVGDLRRRFGRPEKEIALEDQIVVARTRQRCMGILVDGDTDVDECDARDIVAATAIAADVGPVDGIGKTADGLVIIQDLGQFLSVGEELALKEALDGQA